MAGGRICFGYSGEMDNQNIVIGFSKKYAG